MALEGKDINDSDIIDQTLQTRNEAGTHTQFKIKLPSGRELESEWLNEDNLKKAIWPWVETVRQHMVMDADEIRAIARRKAAEQKRAAPALVSVSGDVLTAEPAPSLPSMFAAQIPQTFTTNVAPSSSSPPTAANSSPDLFARSGLDLARKDAEYWQGVAQGAMAKWQEASANVEKWERILSAMTGSSGFNGQSTESKQVGNSSASSAQPGNGSRRGRKPGSKNKPKSSPATGTQQGTAIGAVIGREYE